MELATRRDAVEPPAEGLTGLESAFRHHKDKVFRAAWRITGNAADAEDVLQRVFLKLLRREDDPAGLSQNPGSYLHRAAVNAALDMVRSRRGARSVSLEGAPGGAPQDPRQDPDRRDDAWDLRRGLREALARLRPRTAEIFVLRYLEDYDNAAIARMVGLSRPTVAVILHRTRQRLRKELKPFAGGLR